MPLPYPGAGARAHARLPRVQAGVVCGRGGGAAVRGPGGPLGLLGGLAPPRAVQVLANRPGPAGAPRSPRYRASAY